MPRGYMSHSIRGASGALATDEEMEINCKKAQAFAAQFRLLFPQVELYVPGESDEFVQKAYRMGVLTEEEILDVDCALVGDRDFLLVYTPEGYTSRGMQIEIRFADAKKIPMAFVPRETLDDEHIDYLRGFFANLDALRS